MSYGHGWVIEGAWSHVQTPDYWVGSSAWSPDHNRALRFARKQDAEQAASMMLDGLRVRICEHAWARAPEYQQGRAQSAREPRHKDLPLAADSAKGRGGTAMTVTDDMVNRFLRWPLPASVCSDLCVTESKYPHSRSGTNLLTEDETRQMLEFVIGASDSATHRANDSHE